MFCSVFEGEEVHFFLFFIYLFIYLFFDFFYSSAFLPFNSLILPNPESPWYFLGPFLIFPFIPFLIPPVIPYDFSFKTSIILFSLPNLSFNPQKDSILHVMIFFLFIFFYSLIIFEDNSFSRLLFSIKSPHLSNIKNYFFLQCVFCSPIQLHHFLSFFQRPFFLPSPKIYIYIHHFPPILLSTFLSFFLSLLPMPPPPSPYKK